QTKLEQLQDSVGLFLDLMRLDAGDRLGEVSFNDETRVIFDAGSITLITTDNVARARDAVEGLTADDSTHIHDALQRGLSLLTAPTDAANRRRVLIFFSDG